MQENVSLHTVIGYMDTEQYDYRELDYEMHIETGGVYTMVESFLKDGQLFDVFLGIRRILVYF